MTNHDGIAAPLAAALAKKGYDALTPVQEAMRDPALATRDALVSAQTGSGKTVAFGIAIAPTLLGGEDRFLYSDTPLALVVAPTRELALQVKRELDWLYAEAGAQIASCVGGMDYRNERRALERGAHIVVGTPGRLRDHIERGSLDLSAMRAVVLDEADEMLDLGFREDLEFILEATPEERRTLLFSATVPKAIADMAKTFQRDAARITTAGEARQHVDIEYRALSVGARDREHAIINVLRFYEAQTALVFCKTRAEVNHLMARFNNRGFAVVALSGELSQQERTHALQAMRDGRARVCIATDVAARGIDLPGLELVIHADLPSNSETLLHRSGRTGRAGRKGVSALIVTPKDYKKAQRLLQGARLTAEWGVPPSAEEVSARDDERLLQSEVFAEPVAEDETAMVGELLTRFGPEQVAAAFLRQWRAGRSAPEEISVDAGPSGNAPAPKARAEFGASVWFSLSVGREGRAEARWILPKLCDAGGITKNEIGAIRVQADQTFVQIAADAVDGFVAKMGPGMSLEEGAVLTRLPGEPVLERPERKPYSERPERKSFGDKPARKPYERREAPAGDDERPARKPRAAKAASSDYTPREEYSAPAARPAKPREDRAAPSGERKPYAPKKPYSADKSGEGERPRKPYAGKPARAEGGKWDKPKPAYKPRDAGADAPRDAGKAKFGKPEGGKPFGKPGGKPAGKPGGKPFGKPGGFAGKPGGKPAGKPAGKPSTASRFTSAADPSQRLKPRAKPRSK